MKLTNTAQTIRNIKAARQEEEHTHQYVPEYEEVPQTESLDIARLVDEVSVYPVDDPLVADLHWELADLNSKLAAIDFLKNMEKPLRKRVKVLTAFIDKLSEAKEEMLNAGAALIDAPLTQEQLQGLQSHINSEVLDKSKEVLQNSSNEEDRLADFRN